MDKLRTFANDIRRSPTFLRRLLVVAIVLGIVSLAVAFIATSPRRRAIELLRQHGANITLMSDRPLGNGGWFPRLNKLTVHLLSYMVGNERSQVLRGSIFGLSSIGFTEGTLDRNVFLAISRLPELEAFSVQGCEFDPADLEPLAGLPRLSGIWLDNMPLSDAALKPFRKLKHLRWLSVSNTKIDGSAFADTEWGCDTTLEWLVLSNNHLREDIFWRLRRFKKLNRLEMDKCEVHEQESTGDAVREVEDFPVFPSLKELHCYRADLGSSRIYFEVQNPSVLISD